MKFFIRPTSSFFFKRLNFFIFLFLSQTVFAQKKMWQNIDDEPIVFGSKQINPQKYKVLKLDVASIKSFLNKTPLEFTIAAKGISSFLELPLPDGTFEEFMIVESPMMEAALAQKFPEIKTYSGYSLKNPATTARLDFTQRGFHGMILSPEGTFFIDPYSTATIDYYISYDKKDFASKKSFTCGIDQIKQPAIDTPIAPMPNKEVNFPTGINASIGDGVLRNYRLAIAATGEYTAFHGGTVALALAAQVTTMNRVNGVFLRDFAVKMNIIANNNLVIYTDATTDPYTNNNGSAMLTENINNLNNNLVIGSANYDIGHVFSTGGGGVAYLNGPCGSLKGGGVTGSGSPVGDPFDIDYVAHEMGHQFGGNHTQNNNCNRNSSTAFEPGSGYSIMGYAGICAPNVQNNSDAHFHGGNLSEIHTFITGSGNACSTKPTYTNAKPSITSNTVSQTIPKGTPFMLTGVATDADGNASLTYCWDQMDTQVATQPPVGTATGGPSFRGFSPTISGTRYFPRLSDLVTNTTPEWEVLPTVARTLNFRLVVRDNATGGGANDRVDIILTVNENSGPLVVNAPSATGISWAGLSTQTVTWNVANTNLAPVSCSNVDILLSLDGGLTYPITLAANAVNSGTANVTLPNISTSAARIMVKGSGRAFFDISNNNFIITCASGSVSAPTNVSVSQTSICNGSSVTLSATCASGTITWYNQQLSSTNLGTGSGLIQNPTSTITYYAACEVGSCSSTRVATSTLTVITDPTNYSNNQNSICANSSASLTAACAVGTPKWYDSAGTSLQATGSPFVTPSLTANATYKIRCENGSCLSNFVSVLVTVTASASAPTGTSNPTICNNANTSLSATCTTGVQKWYSSNSTTLLYSGSPYITPNLSSNTTYKVRCESSNCQSLFVDVVVTVQSAVVSPTNVLPSVTTTVCAGNTVSLSATCAAGTVSWYSSQTGTASVGTGSPFSLTATSTNNYFPACLINGCPKASTSNIEFNGVLATSDPTFNRPVDLNSLSGRNTRYKSHTFNVFQAGSVTLSLADADGAVTSPSSIDSFIFLYGSGGFNAASPLTNLLAFNDDISSSDYKSKIVTNLAVGTYTLVLSSYAATPTSGSGDNPLPWTYKLVGLNVGTSSVSISVTPAPTQPTAVSVNNTNICEGSSVSLAATCATGTITWYNAATGGASLGTGTGLSLTPASTITYYASCENANCKSARVATNQVTVNAQPTNPTAVSVNNTIICEGNSVSLNSTCATGIITWYNTSTSGTAIGTGTGLSQTPASTIIYYASCENANCKSARVATSQVTVLPQTNSVTSNISTGTSIVQAAQTINASNKVISPAKVTYKAGNSISLNTGFEAQTGSVFVAQIQGCN